MSVLRPTAMLSFAFCVAAASLAAEAPAAPAKKDPGPTPAPVQEVHFPSFAERTLANGLKVVVIEQHEQPLVSLRMVLRAGRTFEPADRTGLANATASLLTKGTTTRSAQQLAEAIDFVGGNLTTGAGLESGYASAGVTSDQLDLGFELLADVILHPTFPADELDRWRRQALSQLQVSMEDASYVASGVLPRVIFGDHPYGRPSDGTAESLASITQADLVAYHKRRYVPNGTLIAVVGDVRADDAFARVERAFGAWAKGEEAVVPAVPAQARQRRVIVVDKPDAVQTEIRVGAVGIPYTDPDLFAAEVYGSVVGGAPSSRLNIEIRRKRGLAYGAGSGFLEPTQPGYFSASTSTKTESTAEALKLMLDVLRGMQTEPVPDKELLAAKTFITGALPLQIETADGTASRVLEVMRYGYGREFLESYNGKLEAVSAAELQKFATKRVRPGDLDVVLVGNAAAFAKAVADAKLGTVETIPVDEVDLLRNDLHKPKAAAAKP